MGQTTKMICFLLCCHLIGFSLGVQIHQSPSAAIRKAGDDVKFFCTHGQSAYRVMLWYQQSPGDTALKLVGYGYVQFTNDSVEKPFREHFKLAGDLKSDAKNGSLSINNLNAHKHTATYFCAAREGRDAEPAYFGKGTKLTVLEKDRDITPPTVKVLPPSTKECRNQKDGPRKKTIVCVASGFYPDHVSVKWKIDGIKATSGVATDNAALQEGRYYRITSRLKVSGEDWFTLNTNFTCIVEFFDGTATIPYEDTVLGVEGEEGGMTRENYFKISQTAKLSYALLIIKSSLYGAFVAFLVWKLQRSTGKRNN